MLSEPQLSSRRKLLPFAIVAVCVLFAWFAVRNYASFDWVRFAKTFQTLRPGWLCGGVIFSLASFLGRAVRWQAMMRPAQAPLGSIAAATYIGFSAVVLFGRAGELVRPYLIARRAKTTLAAQAGVWTLERLYDFLLILLLFGIGISYARKLGGADSRFALAFHIGGALAIGFAVLAFAILYVMARKPAFCRKRLNEATTFLPPDCQAQILAHLDGFLEAIQPAGQPHRVLVFLAFTVLEWVLILGGVYCYFRAFPPAASFGILSITAYFGFVAFGSIVQLPGIGGGMQVVSAVVLTGIFRMPAEQVVGLSLLVWAGTSPVVLLGGLPLAFYEGLTWRKLRLIEKEAKL